ncbi:MULTISPECIES: ATP-binding protein [Streptomyces]|nr:MULTISPECIES: ATP-binding protein [Streptomyces]MCH0557255.1 ATP-binding protein [Streptomyces sp. MUM 16J]
MYTKHSSEARSAPTVSGTLSSCAGHSGLVVIAVPADERHVSAVRHRVAACLDAWRISLDDQVAVVLIVGELAANAALHGRDDMTVMIGVSVADVHIHVIDSGGTAGSREQEIDEDEHGRGLNIIRCLAQSVRWHSDAARTWVHVDYCLGGVQRT